MEANRFRFRAWDRNRQKMTADFYLDPEDGIPKTTFGTDFGDESFPLDERRHTVMQSTGLIDRNRKEIFEGDILRDEHHAEDPRILIVRWWPEVARFRFDLSSGGQDWQVYFHADSPGILLSQEVIGNIYENPDLLKEKV